MGDFVQFMRAKEVTEKYYAQYDAAGAHLEKARMEERCAQLLSQHEPVASIGIDREKLRVIIDFIKTGRYEEVIKDE
jgi:hypothetical protein